LEENPVHPFRARHSVQEHISGNSIEHPPSMPRTKSSFLITILAVALFSSQAVFSKAGVQSFASLPKPVSVTWTGSAFIASSRDGITKLVNVGIDGSVQPFATSFTGEGEVYVAVSPGQAGFPAGELFLCSGDSVYEVDPSGASSRLVSTPAKGTTINFLAFDGDGSWGFLLYALGTGGQLWAIDPSGRANLVTNLGAGLTPEGIAVAPPAFGKFAGDMLVSMEGSHSVVAIPRSDPSNFTTLANFPGEAPERVMLIPANSDLFLAKYDQGVIVRMNSSAFSSYAGSLLVITEGEAGQTGSINILKAAGSNVTVVKVFQDPASPHFEGAAFVPTQLATAVITTSTGVTTGVTTSTLYAGLATAAAAVVVAVVLVVIRGRRAGRG